MGSNPTPSATAVRAANPGFVFDQVSVDTLQTKNITFEPAFSGIGNHLDRAETLILALMLASGWPAPH